MNDNSYSLGRHCAICDAPIGDNNPDGIGSSCRDVWNKAYVTTIYNFYGLDIWKEKALFLTKFFIKTFKTTKFRSSFRKSFFISMKEKFEFTDNMKISKKQYNIMYEWLFGSEYAGGYAKIKDHEIKENFDESLKDIFRKYKEKFCKNMTSEQHEYLINCSKKYYNESKKRKSYVRES